MATYTTNLNLKKPDGVESIKRTDLNGNFDIIDQSIGDIEADSAETRIRSELIATKSRKTLMSFVDDDGRAEVLDKWVSIIQNKSIPMSVAVITNNVGTTYMMTWEQLAYLQTLGVELLNHTANHPYLSTLTETQLEADFEASKQALTLHGGVPDILVYPRGDYNDLVRKVARNYFRAALALGIDSTKIPTPPLHTYNIYRIILTNDTGGITLDQAKARVDECVANKGWLIWCTHSQNTSFTTGFKATIESLIDYAVSKGVEIVNIEDGLNLYGNVVDAGDYKYGAYDESYYVIGCDGTESHGGPDIKMIFDNSADITKNTLPTYFTAKEPNAWRAKTTRTIISNNAAAGFPESYGILDTHIGNNLSFYYQIFMGNSGTIFKRRYDPISATWYEFDPISSTVKVVPTVNTYTFSTPITSFSLNQITESWVNSAGAAGFPNSVGGHLTTRRLGGNGFDRQDIRSYMRDEVWTRHTTTTGEWTDFVPLTPISFSTSNRPTSNYVSYTGFDTTLGKNVTVKTAGVKEIDTLTITSGATVSGNITIKLGTTNYTVAVTAGMTVAQVDAAIRATDFGVYSWKVSGTVGSGVIVFTKLTSTSLPAPTFTDTGSTGVVGTFAVTRAGVDTVWVDATGTVV
jgi:peptidoglycan/xylan/chitin deacetylase (PgdA/CDA1 family)